MKACFCAYDWTDLIIGPNMWLRHLLPRLLEAGIRPRVLVIGEGVGPFPMVDFLEKAGVPCKVLVGSRYTEERVMWLIRELVADPPDVFVPNYVVPAYYAGRWARTAGLPTVGVLHSDDQFYRAVQDRFVSGPAEDQLSAVVCVSKYLEAEVLARKPCGTIITRIPYGVHVPTEVTKAHTVPMRLVYVGRLDEEQKRISHVVRCLCQAAKEIPSVEAVIYGDGPARSNVERHLRDSGAGLPVVLAGNVDNSEITARLGQCHTFVLLSAYEGLPIALLEAMACGLVPIVSQMRSGISEVIDPNVTGIIVDDSIESFVSAVRRLTMEKGLWDTISRNARNLIEIDYSEEVAAKAWQALLDRFPGRVADSEEMTFPRNYPLPDMHPEFNREDRRRPALPKRLAKWGCSKAKNAARLLKSIVRSKRYSR